MSEEELNKLREELMSFDHITLKRALLIAKNMKNNPPTPEQRSFLEKANSFAKSYISKGITGKKAAEPVKSLRVLSCHGGSGLEPCQQRKNSEKYPGSFYCGACGCGDKGNTQLINIKNEKGEEQYSKLDFPKVYCPLKMPGFSDYTSSEGDEQKNSRKIVIETSYGVEYIKANSNQEGGEIKYHETDNNNEDKQEDIGSS